ncbi:MAG: FG-GAP-like repeat-containing protein [Candidatus Promineifilaceae bacterium]
MKNKLNFFKLTLFSLFLVIGISLLVGSSLPVFASPTNGTEVPKWTRTLPADTCPGSSGTNCHWGSPVLAYIDSDNKLDIVAVTNNGYVIAVRQDNTVIWQKDIAPAFGMAPGTQEISSSPAVADIDNDGFPEIAVGAGSIYASHCTQGGVIVLTHTGSVKPGWPQKSYDADGNGCRDTVFASPALGDINGDGDMEVIAGGFDKRIYAWDSEGHLLPGFPPDSYLATRFPTWTDLRGRLADTIWSSPALADLDGDGNLDIIIGTDEGNYDSHWPGNTSGWNCNYAPPPGWPVGYCGGSIYALDYHGDLLPGFPIYHHETIQSTPAVADLNMDGYPEIFYGTGSFYYTNSPDHPTAGFRLYGIDRHGNALPGWSGGKVVGGPTPSSPVIGDITGDGVPEIIIATMNEKKLYAFKVDGSLVPGFPMKPLAQTGQALAGYNVGSSFVLGDYDHDNKMEIFLSQGWGVAIVDGNGQQLTMTHAPDDNRPLYLTGGSLLSVPAVGDIDNDGKLEMVATNSQMNVWDLNSSSNQADWPMSKKNPARTSSYPQPPQMLAGPDSLIAMHQTGHSGTAETTFVIKNTGGLPFDWTASQPSGVTVTPSSGTLQPNGTAFVTVKMQVSGSQSPGTYPMGSVQLNASSDQGSVVDGSMNIPVKLLIGNISYSFVPTVFK